MIRGIEFKYLDTTNVLIDYNCVFPLKQHEYEGSLYPVPNNIESYLKNAYDNYMVFPDTIARHQDINSRLNNIDVDIETDNLKKIWDNIAAKTSQIN